MKVVILGSGNVATHLGRALKTSGHSILQVWSRSKINADLLASELNSLGINSFEDLDKDGDIYIISVSDDAIPFVASKFPFKDKLLVHTSGTTGIDVLEKASAKRGVLYPLQTFSKQRDIDFEVIPIAIEGDSQETVESLSTLAKTLVDKVVLFDSEKRRALHIAAVFACNFTNHFYSVAHQILKENHLDFDLIRPLIAETASKVQTFLPEEVQTGPAVRNDQITLNKHIKFLEDKPELEDLYKMISQSIINFYQKA